jgi:hypothetical protein
LASVTWDGLAIAGATNAFSVTPTATLSWAGEQLGGVVRNLDGARRRRDAKRQRELQDMKDLEDIMRIVSHGY